MGRLNCGSSSADHKGYWEIEGYGLLGVYKSDWIHFGGKLLYDCCFNLIVNIYCCNTCAHNNNHARGFLGYLDYDNYENNHY